MSKEFTQDTIERYLKNQLQGEELSDFKAKLESDSAFKKEVGTQQLLYRGANKAGEEEMRIKLKKIRNEVLNSTSEDEKAKVVSIGQGKKSNPVFKWSIAAAVIIALGAALYWLVPVGPTSQELFANYYEPFSEEISVRGGNNDALINQASQLYQAGDYQSALPLFQQILNAPESNAEIQLAAGICQLELNQFEEAKQTFQVITNPLFQDQAQWYLAMTYLKQGDLEQAKSVLQQIPSGAFNYQKAQEILTQ